MKPYPIAILVSDLHLQLNRPVAREEGNWVEEVVIPALDYLKTAAEELPVICAGDIFDHWKSSPELINIALNHLPHLYAIPGQHDLPLHNYEDRKKSAYWTLVMAEKITPLDGYCSIGEFVAWGFPWGFPITPLEKSNNRINLVVAHEYIWTEGCGYAGADKSKKTTAFSQKLKGYDAAVFGDNHIPFVKEAGGCCVFNHGCFIPRKSDERSLTPRLGVLMSDGTITLHKPNPVKPKWAPVHLALNKERESNADRVIAELQELGATGLDFVEAVKIYIQKNRTPEGVAKIIRAHLEQNGS